MFFRSAAAFYVQVLMNAISADVNVKIILSGVFSWLELILSSSFYLVSNFLYLHTISQTVVESKVSVF